MVSVLPMGHGQSRITLCSIRATVHEKPAIRLISAPTRLSAYLRRETPELAALKFLVNGNPGSVASMPRPASSRVASRSLAVMAPKVLQIGASVIGHVVSAA